MHKKQKPVIGGAVDRAEIEKYRKDPRGLMEFLRAKTLRLAK
jgi:hypothetical protein